MKTNDNNLFPNLFNDPLQWSRTIANSKKILFFSILIQILFVIVPSYFLYKETSKILTDGFFYTFGLIIVFGCWIPALYLYAIYRLIKIIDSNCPHCGNRIAPAGKPAFSPFIVKALLVITIILVILCVIMFLILYLGGFLNVG